jgi:hypothetical protein
MNTQRVNYCKFVDFIFNVANNNLDFQGNILNNVPQVLPINNALPCNNFPQVLSINNALPCNNLSQVLPINNVLPCNNVPQVLPINNTLTPSKIQTLSKDKQINPTINKNTLSSNNILDFKQINKQLELEIKEAKSIYQQKKKMLQKNKQVGNEKLNRVDQDDKFNGKIIYDAPRRANFLLDEEKIVLNNFPKKTNKEEFYYENYNNNNPNLNFEESNLYSKNSSDEIMNGTILFDRPRKKNFLDYEIEETINQKKKNNKNLIEPFEDSVFNETYENKKGQYELDLLDQPIINFEITNQSKQNKKKVSWDNNLYEEKIITNHIGSVVKKNDNNNLEFTPCDNNYKKRIGKNKLYDIENEYEEGICNYVILYQNYVDLYKTTKFSLTMDGQEISKCKSNLQSVGNFIHLKITFYSLIGKKKNKKIIYHSLTEYELWAYENRGKYFIYNLAEEKEEENLVENDMQEPKDMIEQSIIYATNGGICIYATIYFYILDGKFMIDFEMNNSYEKFYASNFANLNIIRYSQKT